MRRLVSVLMVIPPAAAAAAWEPPIGVPRPPFGIDERAPALPSPWSSDVPGFYFVQTGGTNNGNGNPGAPRGAVPSTLPAGSVVVISGTYSVNHSVSPITANGTPTSPVFIRGLDASSRATLTEKWEVFGSYFVLEYLNGTWANASGNGKLIIDGDHGVVRHSEWRGDTGDGVGGVYPGGAYMVIWDNYIHDMGDVGATYDQDNHCIAVGTSTAHLWVVDNEIARCSGDGMQINGDLATTHHIYFGRNVSHGHKQTGMWSKTASDVVFSQNVVYNIRPSGSSGGGCTGAQYGPDYVWWLFNHLYDCESGIRTEGDSGLGAASPTRFFVGNVIRDITTSGSADPGNPHGAGAIVLRGGSSNYVVNNTIWNYQAGVMSPTGGFVHIENNIFGARHEALGRDIFLELSGTASASRMQHNIVFTSPVRITWGSGSSGPVYDLDGFRSATGKGQSSSDRDPLLVDPAGGNYRPTAASDAIDAGVASSVFATFMARYGIDIGKDLEGRPRPSGAAFDIGAYELGATDAVPPAPPANLRVD